MAQPAHLPEHRARTERVFHQSMEQAVTDFQRITADSLAIYEREARTAADLLDRALTTAETVYKTIMDPAQAAYDRATKMAADAVAGIVDPAFLRYHQQMEHAESGWKAVYPEAHKALERETEAANAVREASKRTAA